MIRGGITMTQRPHAKGDRSQRRKWLPILMYHRVVDEIEEADPYHVYITTENFEAQMRYVHDRGYQSISLEDAVAASGHHESNWSKPIVITFDDGYMDTYTKAFPILQKYGLNATVPLVSGHIGGYNLWDKGTVIQTPILTQTEIQEMARYGFTFASHTVNHKPLTSLNDDEAYKEIAESKTAIELQGGTEAHPEWNPKAIGEHMRRDGYRRDCFKNNSIAESGWLTLAYTGGMLKDDPDGVIKQIVRVIEFRLR